MAVLEDPPVRPGVADQSQVRAAVLAAEAHDAHDHDDQHDGEHAFAGPEAARIALSRSYRLQKIDGEAAHFLDGRKF